MAKSINSRMSNLFQKKKIRILAWNELSALNKNIDVLLERTGTTR